MAANDVELEVLLGWVPEAKGFRITILYSAPGDQEDNRYFGRDPIRFDLETLNDDLQGETDVAEYGQLLGSMLFADAAQVPLDKAVAASQTAPVHLRIVVDPHAPPDYHAIRWETICQPSTGQPLTTRQNIRFSRFMAPSRGVQPTLLPRMGEMDALVAVANPAGIANFASGSAELEPIAVEAELTRARTALGHMNLRELPANGRRATRANIIEELSKGVHVLYLVCHGRMHDGRPQLLLEDEDGNTAVVDGTAFANDFGSMERIPTVVVLCSCESAGTRRIDQLTGTGAPDASDPRMSSTAKDLAAIGPALAYAGATVVVGMQGNLTMRTAQRLLPRFFEELKRDGVPAQAMAEARLAVRDRSDWYMPVLYSRLRKGSAWYREKFGGDDRQVFQNLHIRIKAGHCTPIVGSGIAGEDGVLPSRQELADQWVTRRQMPISEVSRTDLATVAQFVRVADGGGISLVRDEMQDLLLGELKARHAKSLPQLDFDTTPLHELVSQIGRHQRAVSNGSDGYSKLAALGLPVYITTSSTSLLEEALVEHDRSPVVRHFDWRKSTSGVQWPYEPSALEDDNADEEDRREVIVGARDRGGKRFSVDEPLVYHLSGTLEYPRTLVLTEDDYFIWLQEWMKQVDNGNSIPGYVRRPLITNSLLFLGYHFDDWEFRMIFQAIKSFQQHTDDDGPHVGVQLEPSTLRVDREAAQSYLVSYFGADKIRVYWQTCNMFLIDLEESKKP
jgi:CHAT domain-containing protein/SIR2-like protein